MSKAKIKKIKIPMGDDTDIGELFSNMLGVGSTNITIAYPRYKRIRKICEQLIKLFELLAATPFMRTQPQEKSQLDAFCADSRATLTADYIDLSDYEWNLTLVDDGLRELFCKAYEVMKKSHLINSFIIMYDRLVKYSKHIANENALSYKFINLMPGTEWLPFPFCDLNLKYIFALDSLGENTLMVFLTILHKSHELSAQLYEELQSPDVDVSQFAEVIMANIDEIQKRPELSRCRRAFQKIKESVELLKTRFNGYYRDFISTKDSTIMMQHFILDVSKETNADPEVTRQFRIIIAYYRKMAQSQINNPKIKMLFDKVNESFEKMERGTENLVNIRGGEAQDEEVPELIDSDPIVLSTAPKTLDDITKK